MGFPGNPSPADQQTAAQFIGIEEQICAGRLFASAVDIKPATNGRQAGGDCLLQRKMIVFVRKHMHDRLCVRSRRGLLEPGEEICKHKQQSRRGLMGMKSAEVERSSSVFSSYITSCFGADSLKRVQSLETWRLVFC